MGSTENKSARINGAQLIKLAAHTQEYSSNKKYYI
jgi:hypothetical protein